jgi:hypothetical protein
VNDPTSRRQQLEIPAPETAGLSSAPSHTPRRRGAVERAPRDAAGEPLSTNGLHAPARTRLGIRCSYRVRVGIPGRRRTAEEHVGIARLAREENL